MPDVIKASIFLMCIADDSGAVVYDPRGFYFSFIDKLSAKRTQI